MIAFHSVLPELAQREVRCIHLEPEPGVPLTSGLPAGEYAFVEFYCEDLNCDCRRVFIQVIARHRQDQVLASINYGWEEKSFYQKRMPYDPKAPREIVEGSLDPINTQSGQSQELLELFQQRVLDQPYRLRLRQHYELFREELRRRRNVSAAHDSPSASEARAASSSPTNPKTEEPRIPVAHRERFSEVAALLQQFGQMHLDSELTGFLIELWKRVCRRKAPDCLRGKPAVIAARDDTRPLYLNTPGYRVGCKDEVLQIKDKDRLVEEVRMRDVSHVALFGNIQISTQAIQSLCEQEVPVTYFSMGGWFYGITRGHAMKNVFPRVEQFRLARDEMTCLTLARQFVHGKIRNHRTLLMRNHLEPPEVIIGKLKRASEDALAAASIEELLGIEGAAASQYFQQFSGMVKVEDDLPGLEMPGKDSKQRSFNFNFNNRNRRPPTDPVNAMLSLAYSMLSKDCTLAALAVGFDPYLGFYHQPRFGRPALGLDLMEEFRPLIAESTVLSCINNRVVTEKDFVRAGQAVNLTAPGRKRFFQTYEQRMSSLITHPLFDYKVSYRRALELQARLLAKTLTGEIAEYIPLMTR